MCLPVPPSCPPAKSLQLGALLLCHLLLITKYPIKRHGDRCRNSKFPVHNQNRLNVP
ncbi:hypothetical protein GQ607_010050 [Colletotrichum asianum]|uniref:Uncharacterized protein n=1 Tax=Colletotrichum asianum TaxID=702518 RepID=A0A8H3ZK54_9PEZI|nr:hypothetical protein GQ607_010050 [Colletotrichum asianum]